MCCTRLAACLALCGCLAPMVRAPKEMPRDGVVVCTDSLQTPLTALAIGVASAGVVSYGVTHPGGVDDAAAEFYGYGVLTMLGIGALFAAAEGAAHAQECRDAKRRGAVVAEQARHKSEAREEAGRQWKQAAAAARADDCATVRELNPQIRQLDVELHDIVFMRDVAIARCLAGTAATR